MCSEECWSALICPTCGGYVPPRGKNGPGPRECCEELRYAPANTRHYWSESEFLELMEDYGYEEL